MSALHNFIRAAASYYGAPVDQLTEGCAIDSSTGEFEVVLRFVVSPEDLAGIGKRMEVMLREAQVDEAIAQKAQAQAAALQPTQDDWRMAWDRLDAPSRSRYGSFARFIKTGPAPEVATPEAVVVPPVAWLEPNETADELQRMMAVGRDERGRYGISVEDLTEQQRAMLEASGRMP